MVYFCGCKSKVYTCIFMQCEYKLFTYRAELKLFFKNYSFFLPKVSFGPKPGCDIFHFIP